MATTASAGISVRGDDRFNCILLDVKAARACDIPRPLLIAELRRASATAPTRVLKKPFGFALLPLATRDTTGCPIVIWRRARRQRTERGDSELFRERRRCMFLPPPQPSPASPAAAREGAVNS